MGTFAVFGVVHSKVGQLCKKIPLYLATFHAIRNELSTEAAKTYLHSMILRHFDHYLTSWSRLE